MGKTILIKISILLAGCMIFLNACAVVTTPVEVAGEVVKTGVKVVTYPVRKAVE